MTKRSIAEIVSEISECRKRYREIVDANLYRKTSPGGVSYYAWRNTDCVYELNRINRHIRRLHYEKNQAFFRDWDAKIRTQI